MPDVNELGSVPAAGTANNVPAHIQALKDSINTGSLVRRLSQAQIDALGADQKPIGVLVYNATTSRVERWTGAGWVCADGGDRLPLTGGTLSGDVNLNTANVDRSIVFMRNVVVRRRLVYVPTTGEVRWQRFGETGVLQGTDLTVSDAGVVTLGHATDSGDASGTIVTKGYADSIKTTADAALPAARAKAGVWSGTTAVDGQVSISLGTPPSGTSWSFVPVGVKPVTCTVVSVTGGTAVVQTSVNSTAASFHWHAIAY